MDDIALQERQGLLQRRLEGVTRDGFHRNLAGLQDMALLEGLVTCLEFAVRGEPLPAAMADAVLGDVPSVRELRALRAAEREAAAAERVRQEMAAMREGRGKGRRA